MSEHQKHYVTLAEVDAKLDKATDAIETRMDKLPTRWEVRFLIVIGLVGSQLLPVNEAANAAIAFLK